MGAVYGLPCEMRYLLMGTKWVPVKTRRMRYGGIPRHTDELRCSDETNSNIEWE